MRMRIQPLDRGFDPDRVVTNHIPLTRNDHLFTPDGIFSEIIFGKMMSSGREHSCECGKMQGTFFKGLFCSECGTQVVRKDGMYSRRGWIDLGEYSILHPMIYHYLLKAFKGNALVKILSEKPEFDVDGNPVETEDAGAGSSFAGIGMHQLKERFDEVVSHFRKSAKEDTEPYFQMIDLHKDLAFTSRIPIFSHILRPAIVQRDMFSYDEINNLFNLVINFNRQLQGLTSEERTPLRIDGILWGIQEKVVEIAEDILTKLSGKFGYLRTSLLGTRINFSARSVITPLSSGHEMDELHIPYLSFLELFRFQIINVIQKTKGVSILEADEIWARAQSTFDPFIHNICQELVRSQDGWPCLLNRNPSIAFGSILMMRITKVKDNPRDYTFSLSNSILRLIGGDYDGDEVNIAPLLDRRLVKAFSVFDPRTMLIDRSTLEFSNMMDVSKDHLLGLTILTEEPPAEVSRDDP